MSIDISSLTMLEVNKTYEFVCAWSANDTASISDINERIVCKVGTQGDGSIRIYDLVGVHGTKYNADTGASVYGNYAVRVALIFSNRISLAFSMCDTTSIGAKNIVYLTDVYEIVE